MGTVTEHGKLFIGGSYVDPATDAKLEMISPVTEEVFGRVPEASRRTWTARSPPPAGLSTRGRGRG